MRIPRVFINAAIDSDQTLHLDSGASHYLSKVLRMQKGRALIVFNDSGNQWHATIKDITKKTVAIETHTSESPQTESPLNTHLAIGISRGERFDWVVQKATELGVSAITPLFTERCEVKLQPDRIKKKCQHWQQISISACEQSLRTRIPSINTPVNFNDFLDTHAFGEHGFVLHHRCSNSIKSIASLKQCTLVVGPEGGLTEHEIHAAQEAGYTPMSLGPRVLRTETAPISALSLLQWQFGDF